MQATRPSEVIYQIYPSSFADSNGDGHGDLRGIIQKMDYIQSLNVDAIWISPFYPSPPGPEGDGGYAVSNYRDVDPKFGTLDDFRDLLHAAHKRGLRVYTDFVLAHTAASHDWFSRSQAREENYADRYVWHDGVNGGPPNNWKSVFGGSAWTWDQARGQYYLHHFLSSQPALNLNAPHVQDAVLEEMKFWFDMGVDGFRLDALPFCNHDAEFGHNEWLSGYCPFSHEHEYWDQQRFTNSMAPDKTIDFVSRIRALAEGYKTPKNLLGEVIAGLEGGRNSIPLAARFVERETGTHACYTEALMGLSEYPSASRLRDMIIAIENHFPDGGNCNAASNHDIPRSATRMTANLPFEHREAAARQLMQLFAVLPGSFCMYQGEELGLPQATAQDVPLFMMKDAVAWTRGEEHSRDRQRTPMVWNKNETHAGFSDAPDPYLPVAQAHYDLSVDQQHASADSFLNMTRDLLAWRRLQPAVVQGKTFVLQTPDPVLVVIRQSPEQTFLSVFNFSDRAVEIRLSDYMRDDVRRVEYEEPLALAPFGHRQFGDNPLGIPKPQTGPQTGRAPRLVYA